MPRRNIPLRQPRPDKPKHAVKPRALGVMVVNLGSPRAPTTPAVKTFLAEFLSDSRVVPLPRLLWQLLLRAIILPIRSPRSAKKYQLVWRANPAVSPLHHYTASIAHQLQQLTRKKQHGATATPLMVVPAYRYGINNIEQAMTSLRAAGCRRIVVLPLYPHYSSSTTASIVDEIGRILRGLQHQPTVNIVPPYFDHPQFIDLLARSVRRAFPHRLPDHILVSNHGIPESMVRRGDPYSCQAKKTARLLQQTLGCNNQQMSAAFQSRFGAAEWVKPYSVARVKQLAESGLSHLAVIAPSFAVDCLETLEEINIGLREDFIHHHPTTSPLAATAHRQPQFSYIPCLNDEADVIDFYHQLILPYIS